MLILVATTTPADTATLVAYALATALGASSVALVGLLRRRRSPLRRLLDRRLAPARGFDVRTTGSRTIPPEARSTGAHSASRHAQIEDATHLVGIEPDVDSTRS